MQEDATKLPPGYRAQQRNGPMSGWRGSRRWCTVGEVGCAGDPRPHVEQAGILPASSGATLANGNSALAVFDPDWRVYRIGVWLGVAASAALALTLLASGNWGAALTVAGFMLPAVASVFLVERVPPMADLFLVLAALLNGAGYAWDLYDAWALFDKVTHGYTLFALTLPLAFLTYGRSLTGLRLYRVQLVLVIASFGIAVGALWEVAEWAYDLVVPGDVIKGKADTIMDLIADTGGALLAAVLGTWMLGRRTADTREVGR